MHNKRKTAEESESSKRNKRTYEFKSGKEYFTRTSLGDWSAAAAIEAYTSTPNLPLDELYQIMECDLHELSQKRSNYIEPARRMLSDLGLIMNFARKQQRAAGNHQYNVSKNNHVEINNALINKPSYNVDKKIDERSEVESATGNERTENENTAPEQHKGIQGTNLRADEGRDSQTQRKQEEKEEAIRLNSFENSFRLMQDDQKWKLQSTGRYVEDVLFNYGKSMTKEHLCHSFVIDPWDQTYLKEKIFNAEEIAEMKRFNTKCLPKMPHDLKEYLKLYERARSAQEARNIIMMPQVWDNPFDREKYFDHDWIRSSYYQIVREIEAGHIQKNDKLESWVIARVWTIVDRVFDDIENMSVIRGESTSKASSIRKNSRRLPQGTEATKRRKMGRRLDLIFRKRNLEYGGGEAGKDYTADTDTKLLNERDLKLPKALKDMLDLLISQNIKKEKIRKLEVIGLLQYDLTMSMIRLDAPAGYVYRMTRTGNVTVPHDFSQLPELRKVLYMAWCGKAIVRQAIEELEKMDEGEEDDDLEQVMEPIDNEEAILAATFTSPEQPDRYRPSYSLDE